MKQPKGMKCCGKGSREEDLPNRFARATITKGDPMQRAMNNYSKKAPSMQNMGLLGAMGMIRL